MDHENVNAENGEPHQCRALVDSFHVGYTTNEEGHETENLTHKRIINTDAIEERGDTECGWVAQLVGAQIQLLISGEIEEGWSVSQVITPETADQLSDMFARVAAAARERQRIEDERLEAERQSLAELDARQGSLLADDQNAASDNH